MKLLKHKETQWGQPTSQSQLRRERDKGGGGGGDVLSSIRAPPYFYIVNASSNGDTYLSEVD